jgi:hypothetical protein
MVVNNGLRKHYETAVVDYFEVTAQGGLRRDGGKLRKIIMVASS